ncbi:methyl-accepting chemotaxis protein [Candidatus Nitrosotenuis uzonensis]|uniref:Methyl-accepting chemotaxis sensory transducer n=1 Tax=Candidatus Nitrosotenuis uzonensis TaxID=1407055 RepID=A0A812F2Y1_9ARCH|nr:methyl-accepting chemotaxis protein [Candidatus Nitrosotenuis uzonensis]CAE6496969.1 Methyl-accepting chemotaxis sensory transducer [Candidatus Nitrosotenuis uzonensis]
MQQSELQQGKKFTLEEVVQFTDLIAEKLNNAIDKVDNINHKTHVLSVNASIEAARAGTYGRPFGIVATNMSELSEETTKITEKMRNDTKEILNVGAMIKVQAKDYRGNRLSDLALVNIDLIDRNLYERTADVRWWATDGSVVDALTKKNTESYDCASKRLGVILQAYTVYYDLVLADTDGKIVANGSPEKYSSTNLSVADSKWFTSAMKTKSGNEFGFESVHHSPLVSNNLALVYSCAVREGGNTKGGIIGVLGVIFKWESLAQTIIQQTPIDDEEKKNTRICITDDDGLILADSDGKMLKDKIQFDKKTSLYAENKNYLFSEYMGYDACLAHAHSQGFEGYSTGWHSVIIQKLANMQKTRP